MSHDDISHKIQILNKLIKYSNDVLYSTMSPSIRTGAALLKTGCESKTAFGSCEIGACFFSGLPQRISPGGGAGLAINSRCPTSSLDANASGTMDISSSLPSTCNHKTQIIFLSHV